MRRRSTLPRVKFLSRLLTALDLLPPMATLAVASKPILRHTSTKRAPTFDAGTIVLAEIGNRFVIGRKPGEQPHHFDVAASFTLAGGSNGHG